jgi:hypothetical protein
MTRTTVTVLAALMFGGASVAYAGGAGKSSSDHSYSPSRSEADGSGSGTTSGMSAGASNGSSSSATSPSTSGSTASGATAGSASRMSASDVEAKLEKQGYTDVSGVKKVGDKFEAKAMKNGKSVNVEVDPATGAVKQKS